MFPIAIGSLLEIVAAECWNVPDPALQRPPLLQTFLWQIQRMHFEAFGGASFEMLEGGARCFLTWKGTRCLSLRSTDIVPYDELIKTWSTSFFQVRCWSTCTPNSFVQETRFSGVSPQAIGSFGSSKLWYRAICEVEIRQKDDNLPKVR